MRTFVVIFFNEVNSINQSNFFNLSAIVLATGLRKLKDFFMFRSKFIKF